MVSRLKFIAYHNVTYTEKKSQVIQIKVFNTYEWLYVYVV